MCELEIALTVRRFDREDYGSVVYGIMKEGSTHIGRVRAFYSVSESRTEGLLDKYLGF